MAPRTHQANFAKTLDLLKLEVIDESEVRRANEVRRAERAQLEGRQQELNESLAAQSERHNAITALPAQLRSFLQDFQDLEVRRAKALLQPILKSAHAYRDGHIELEFRGQQTS